MSDKIIVKPELFNDVRQFIETARMQVARYANSASVMLYWQIGHRINQDILKNARAEYGEKVISEIAKFLKEHYGSAFDRYNLSRMVRFAKIYSEPQIVVTLSQQLTWSHFVKLIIIDDSLKRDFYTEMCRLQGWTVRGLREKIDSM